MSNPDSPPKPAAAEQESGKGLDETPCCASCYLDDETTAGEMMRWINEEFKQAGRSRDHDMLAAVSRLGDGLETAWRAYRKSRIILHND